MKHGEMKNTENVGTQSIKGEDPKQLAGVSKGKKAQERRILEGIINKNFPELMKNIYLISPYDRNNNNSNNNNNNSYLSITIKIQTIKYHASGQ